MAEKEDKENEKAGQPPSKPGKKRLLVIGGAALALLLTAGVPVVIFALKGAGDKQEELSADAAKQGQGPVLEGHLEEDELEEGEEPLGAIFPFDTFLVNLVNGRYLRCQIQVEFVGRDVPPRFYSKLVPLRDGLINILSSKSSEDISGAQGREELKNELREYINEILRRADVKSVYFTQFVIQ